ncbi:MAG: ABC transporter permease [Burkholderiales bacterium]|nr:ABC transporter permease [Burkholderiales bacterium]
MPLSSVTVAVVDFSIAMLLLLGMLIAQGLTPDWHILVLPALLTHLLVLTLGTGVWMAALSVRYRDVRYVVPFLVQVGLYISPVGYSSTIVPESWRFIFSFNPMVGVIDGFRWALLGGYGGFPLASCSLSAAIALITLISGVIYFRRIERSLIDTL